MLQKDILVLGLYYWHNAGVINDYLLSFAKHSRHRFFYVTQPEELYPGFDFSRFDSILLFWSYPWNLCDLPANTVGAIAESRALKVLMLQDEYRQVRLLNMVMRRLGVGVMLTCVDPSQHEVFYPRRLIPTLKHTETVLTGYVPESLERLVPPDWQTRPIDVGYRSRVNPYYLGDLAREKLWIAERFSRVCREQGLRHDISVREKDRIYGHAWIEFLCRCRFVLGTESGASVIDFDGDLEARCGAYLANNPGASYETVKQALFAGLDWQQTIQTISPRLFEAAACGNVMLLYEGNYAGILEPDVHYIAVRKDHANLAEVLDRMRDESFCRRLRDAAHQHLIASGRYRYQAMVGQVDDILDRFGPARPAQDKRPSLVGFYLRDYLKQGRTVIPTRKGCLKPPSWGRLFPIVWLARELILRPILLVALVLVIWVNLLNVAAKNWRSWRKRESTGNDLPEFPVILDMPGNDLSMAAGDEPAPRPYLVQLCHRIRDVIHEWGRGLLLLALVRKIQKGQTHYGEPLQVRLQVEAEGRRVIFQIEPRTPGRNASREDQQQWQRFQELVRGGRPLTFFFDNSRFHLWVPLKALGWFYVPYFPTGGRLVCLSFRYSLMFARYPWCALSILKVLRPEPESSRGQEQGAA